MRLESGNAVVCEIKTMLLETCGILFEKEREQKLISAVLHRMKSSGVYSVATYKTSLSEKAGELSQLIETLTVNETYFFREPDHLKLVVDALLPKMLRERAGAKVRILSAGCSTGEEPYSIAMMLYERYGDKCAELFSVAGVDIDSAAIACARQARYGKNSFRGTTPAQKFFHQAGSGEFQLSEKIKGQVSFEVVNLLSSPYPPMVQQSDIILYRNVSIYFPDQVQREIFRRLSESLCQSGYLVVGAAETLHHDTGVLSLQQQDGLFFYCKRLPGALPLAPEKDAPPRKRTTVVVTHGPSAKITDSIRRVASPSPSPDSQCHRVRLFHEALDQARVHRPEQALDRLQMLVRDDPGFVKAHILKASILFEISRFDEAASVCNSLTSMDPFCKEGYLMLGLIARQQGNGAEALRCLRQAIYINASCGICRFYYADILHEIGDRARALNAYQVAIQSLEKVIPTDLIFPLGFNAGQFGAICRHKVFLLKGNG